MINIINLVFIVALKLILTIIYYYLNNIFYKLEKWSSSQLIDYLKYQVHCWQLLNLDTVYFMSIADN